MKLWSKEAFLLGGIYSVLSTPFTHIENNLSEQISIGLFIAFLICCIVLFFNKTQKVISKIIKKYPNITYYLISFGWLPYFMIIGFIGFISLGFFFEYEENFSQLLGTIFIWILKIGIPVSLMIAIIRRWIKKVRSVKNNSKNT